MKLHHILIFLELFLLSNTSLAQSDFSEVEYYAPIAGYIKEDRIEIENINGVDYEVLLKNGNTIKPKIKNFESLLFFKSNTKKIE